MRRLLIIVAACLTLIAGVVTAASPQAVAAAPSEQVVFQEAAGTPGADASVVAHTLEDLFKAAGPGWKVWVSMFDLRDANRAGDVVDKLINSIQTSGVELHMVIDDRDAPVGVPHPQVAKNCSGLDSNPNNTWTSKWSRAATRMWCIATQHGRYPLRFHRCKHSCLGPAGSASSINHNKIELFLGPQGQKVLVNGSTNWTIGQLSNKYQSELIVRGHPRLFTAFRTYWNALDANHSNPTYGDTHGGGGTDIGAHFYPSQKDPRLTAVQHANCAKGSTILLATNILTNTSLINTLASKHAAHCKVNVILRKSSATANLTGFPHKCVDTMHSKDLIIDGHYRSGSTYQTVWTGSLPFGNGNGTDDNTDLHLTGASWAGKFVSNFSGIWSALKYGTC